MNRNLINLDNNLLPTSMNCASLMNKLILHDVYDREIPWDGPETTDFQAKDIRLSGSTMLYFVTKGETNLHLNKQQRTIHAGDVMISRNGMLITIDSMSKDIEFFMIAIEDELFYSCIEGSHITNLTDCLVKDPICRLSDKMMRECKTIYLLIKNKLNSDKKEMFLIPAIKGLIQAIVMTNISAFKEKEGGNKTGQISDTRKKETLSKFLVLLKENFITKHNVDFYADKLCMTSGYLSKIISETSGHTISELINKSIITEAKCLINSNTYSILQISEMLSFSSPSSFGRFFKNQVGCTPKEYQQNKICS